MYGHGAFVFEEEVAEGVYTREGWMERADARNGVVCGRVHRVCGLEFEAPTGLSHAILRGVSSVSSKGGVQGVSCFTLRSWTKRGDCGEFIVYI